MHHLHLLYRVKTKAHEPEGRPPHLELHMLQIMYNGELPLSTASSSAPREHQSIHLVGNTRAAFLEAPRPPNESGLFGRLLFDSEH
ncbi:hypothetical protein EYF80_012901 [Liparis tanakae]|uniref:Uncharacterized protein n=1 Tax=Liparis tanakae TaxID=230148 RepID=A0A4Z2IFW6_9TELE|nr:hypothetical protein EYF80_012901 [Liparis tanakae]